MENTYQKMAKGLLRRIIGVNGYGWFFAGYRRFQLVEQEPFQINLRLCWVHKELCMRSCFG